METSGGGGELKYYERGCELGDAISCTNFGARLARVASRAEQATCAARLWRAACSADEPWGCGMLGMAMLRGFGVTANAAGAVRMLDDRCKVVGSFPCTALGKLIENGLIGARDAAKAAALYARACSTGDGGACAEAKRLGVAVQPQMSTTKTPMQ
ncbi:MAG: hypothetical protein AB7O24_10820 [Kofleriaceae bacterium]